MDATDWQETPDIPELFDVSGDGIPGPENPLRFIPLAEVVHEVGYRDPYEVLCFKLIKQAIKDHQEGGKKRREAAALWLFDTEEHSTRISFKEACETLNCCPEHIRSTLLKVLQ